MLFFCAEAMCFCLGDAWFTEGFNFYLSVRTPGGRLVYQYLKKSKKAPKCGQCKEVLRGVKPARPMEKSRIKRHKKSVRRSYGGVMCHRCVKERYVSLEVQIYILSRYQA